MPGPDFITFQNPQTWSGEESIQDIRDEVWYVRAGEEDRGLIEDLDYNARDLKEMADKIESDWQHLQRAKDLLARLTDELEQRESYLSSLEGSFAERVDQEADALAEARYEEKVRELDYRAEAVIKNETRLDKRSDEIEERLQSVVNAIPHIKVLEQVLVDLELDVSPSEIAAMIRSRFSSILTVKEW